jgi:hemolysin III
MIFVLIAGTYTPVCVLALPAAWAIPVLAIVWSGALLGVVLKTTAFERFPILRHALYPILGWTAIVALPVFLKHLSTTQFMFMLAGGVIYTVGLAVFLRQRPDPWPATFGFHEIWHVCTVLAAACHFILIALLVSSA